MSDLVEKVASAIRSLFLEPVIKSTPSNPGHMWPLGSVVVYPDEAAKAALAAIPSLSFDDFRKGIESVQDEDGSFKLEDVFRALTANGDVLIRKESTSESPAQNARE